MNKDEIIQLIKENLRCRVSVSEENNFIGISISLTFDDVEISNDYDSYRVGNGDYD